MSTTGTTTKRKRKASRASWGKVRKLPSGRYQASYVGPDGGRHTAPRTFSAKIDADAWLAAQRVRVDGGTWEEPDALPAASKAATLHEYATDWIASRTGRSGAPLRDRTRGEYTRLLAGPVAPLAGKRVTALKPADVRGWYSTLAGTGKLTTASRAYGLVKAVLESAVEDGLLATNPAAVKGAMTASTGQQVTPPTADELAVILERVTPRLRPMVLLAAYGALRYGECTELRARDVSVDGPSLFVRVERAVVQVTGVGFVVGPPKSEAGVRTVAMPPSTHAAILAAIEGLQPDDLLFPARSGGHLSQSTFTDAWYPARGAAGRPDLHFHALRHYGATLAAQHGATLKELQARLGHSTAGAALRYQHAVAGRDAELASRMG